MGGEIKMSELISGKEAKLAWANGDTVEYYEKSRDDWFEIRGNTFVSVFDNRDKFRLKPRTITINGIEVPATFNPKEGEIFYYINDYSEDGYDWASYYSNLFNNTVWIGKWRTEEDIKQVVKALHSVFNTK